MLFDNIVKGMCNSILLHSLLGMLTHFIRFRCRFKINALCKESHT